MQKSKKIRGEKERKELIAYNTFAELQLNISKH